MAKRNDKLQQERRAAVKGQFLLWRIILALYFQEKGNTFAFNLYQHSLIVHYGHLL